MKKLIIICTFFVLTFSVNSLAQKVTVDYDKSTDFSKMKTYTFLGWQENIDNLINDFDKERFMNAFHAEFKSRNIEKIESSSGKIGDMIVGIYLVIEDKKSVTAYNTYYGGGGGRGYRGGGYGGGYSNTMYNEEEYKMGTLVLNVFDGVSTDLLWEGVATKTVNQKPAKREKSIPKSVKKLMKKFPVEPVE